MIYKNPFYVGMVSTVPPRECGIATFNWDLYNSIKGDNRIEDHGFYSIIRDPLNYDPYIKRFIEMEIGQGDKNSWEKALDNIVEQTNYRKKRGKKTGFFIEHEYGIYGENHETDDNCVELLKGLRENNIPNITITHTILSEPDKHKENVMKGILKYTDKLICLSPCAIFRLMKRYDAPRGKLIHIAHGVPRIEIPKTREQLKKEYGFLNEKGDSRTVVSTVGLISPSKGLEYSIDGFSEVINQMPLKQRKDLVYLIAGATHPEIKRKIGESYREKCIDIAKQKGLNVLNTTKINNPSDIKNYDLIFLNKYLETKEFLNILKMSDIGLVTNLGREQISSGQIAYWVGMGRTMITTESPYAKDMENEGIGLLVKFENSEEISDRLNFFLNLSEEKKQELEFLASDKGVTMSWPIIGLEMLNLMENIINQYNGAN